MTIIFGIIFVAAVTGIYAGFRRRMKLEQWTTGGRGLGAMMICPSGFEKPVRLMAAAGR